MLNKGKAVMTSFGILRRDYKGRYNLNGEWYDTFPSKLHGERYWYYSKYYQLIMVSHFE